MAHKRKQGVPTLSVDSLRFLANKEKYNINPRKTKKWDFSKKKHFLIFSQHFLKIGKLSGKFQEKKLDFLKKSNVFENFPIFSGFLKFCRKTYVSNNIFENIKYFFEKYCLRKNENTFRTLNGSRVVKKSDLKSEPLFFSENRKTFGKISRQKTIFLEKNKYFRNFPKNVQVFWKISGINMFQTKFLKI